MGDRLGTFPQPLRSPWMRPWDAAEDRRMRRARGEMNRAVARGDLVRGECEMADGSCSTRIVGHHDDYSRPLDVRWLCQRHHVLLHRG